MTLELLIIINRMFITFFVLQGHNLLDTSNRIGMRHDHMVTPSQDWRQILRAFVSTRQPFTGMDICLMIVQTKIWISRRDHSKVHPHQHPPQVRSYWRAFTSNTNTINTILGCFHWCDGVSTFSISWIHTSLCCHAIFPHRYS